MHIPVKDLALYPPLRSLAIYELIFTVCIFKADERVTRPSRSRSTNTNAATAREQQDKL